MLRVHMDGNWLKMSASLKTHPKVNEIAALLESPPGTLIEADAYYAFSSVFFYTNRKALLLNGRSANLEYGSYAPHAPQVFIDDAGFVRRWESDQRYYLLTDNGNLPHLRELVGEAHLHVVKQSSGKSLIRNM